MYGKGYKSIRVSGKIIYVSDSVSYISFTQITFLSRNISSLNLFVFTLSSTFHFRPCTNYDLQNTDQPLAFEVTFDPASIITISEWSVT